MSVDADQIREHFETDLSDTALTTLIDDAVAEINRRFGDGSSVTEEYSLTAPSGYGGAFAGYGEYPAEYDSREGQRVGRRRIWTRQRIGSVTSVKEGPTQADDDLTTLVADTDYRVIRNGRAIERIGVDFDRKVIIVYTPENDADRRDRVTIDLVKLAVQYNGLKSEKAGDFAATHEDYQNARLQILSTLGAGRRSYA